MPFSFDTTDIPDLILITPKVFPDGRGYFMESWKRSDFYEAGIREDFVQDNHSYSSRGILRGLHYQTPPHSQGKLVRVITGSVWDVAVDIRRDSEHYGKWYGVELNPENRRMLYIPPGFAHGFFTLSNDTHFLYKCTNEYAPASDTGIRWDDKDLSIRWPLTENEVPAVSDKDKQLPAFNELFS